MADADSNANDSSAKILDDYKKLVESIESKSENDRRLLVSLISFQQKEQSRARRWAIFFRLFYISMFGFLIFSVLFPGHGVVSNPTKGPRSYAAIIDISGGIAQDELASADNINASLRSAFEDSRVKGIILRINSPGGSPVQAGYIYDEIIRLKKEHPKTSVYAVITDLGASAAYFIAAAADEIYANHSSLVGSIGAYIAGFGFENAMQKWGISRRFYKSGEHKGFSDPFLPEDKLAAKHVTQSVASIHRYFISRVKQGRGSRLKTNPQLFSGLIWSGKEAKDLGLIDGLASVREVIEDKIKVKPDDIIDYSVQLKPWERFARNVGMSAASELMSFISLQVN